MTNLFICSVFRSTNETMNVWTHVIGASLFIFLIYLTYAIPVENLFSLRQDITDMAIEHQCSLRNYTDVILDEVRTNSTCIDAKTRDVSLAEEFSNLYYYLSSTNYSSTLNMNEEIHSFYSWFSSNSSTITHEVVDNVLQSLQSLYYSLVDYLQSSPNSAEKTLIEKSVEVTEIITDDLKEFDHKVVGHIPRWPIIVFICCAIWCLGGSAIYHHFYCCNFIVSNVLQTLDYCGICILISGSYVPVIYYSFYYYPTFRRIHLIAVILINVANVSVMATPTFR